LAYYDIRPDQDERPGITKATVQRGWGTSLVVVSGIVILLSMGLGTFGAAPLFVVAVLMLPVLAAGIWLMKRGRSKMGPARPEASALRRDHPQVRLRDEARS
jgi:hypothetical protein